MIKIIVRYILIYNYNVTCILYIYALSMFLPRRLLHHHSNISLVLVAIVTMACASGILNLLSQMNGFGDVFLPSLKSKSSAYELQFRTCMRWRREVGVACFPLDLS